MFSMQRDEAVNIVIELQLVILTPSHSGSAYWA